MRHIYVLGDSTPDRKNLIEVTFEREGLHGNPPVIHKEMFCLEKIQQRKPVLRRIRELYDAGVPFFTKDMLKAAVAERDRIIRAQVDKPHVQLRGLDRQVGYDAHMSLVVKFVDGEMRHAFDDDLDSRKITIGLDYRVATSFGALKLGIPWHDFNSNMLTVGLVAEAKIPAPDRQVGQAKKEFEIAKAQWEASELRRHVWDTLMSPTSPISHVKRVILFATGSPTRYDGGIGAVASMQICLGITVKEAALERRRQDSNQDNLVIGCLAQDPEFSPPDIEVLTPYDIKIVDDPEGFLALDDTTAVIVFYPDIAVRNIVLDICRPPIFICNAIKPRPERVTCSLGEDVKFMDCDPALPRVMKAFEEEYVAESMIEGLEFGTELPLAKHFMAGTIYSRRSI